MASVNPPVVTFQGGVIGEELHNRVDIPSYQQGAAEMTNFRPTLQGPMSRRPPLEHIDPFTDHTLRGELYPFTFSREASYLVLATTEGFKFYANDGLIETPEVSASLSGSWTDESTSPASITDGGSRVYLDSDGAADAIAQKIITTSNVGDVHVLAFEIIHGPIDIRIGSTSGAHDLLRYERLRAGVHRLAFTPSGATSYLQFKHASNAGRVLADTVAVLAGPDFILPNPFSEDDLLAAHSQQIRDVLYIAHTDYWTRRLERRGDRSWSIVKMLPDDGPFGDSNTSTTTLAGDATSGEITLTASADLFSVDDEGVLYSMTSSGQLKTTTASAAGTFTDGIKVTGIGATDRTFNIAITGAFVATVTLQRSSGNENNYTDWQTYTTPQSVNIYDAQDNQTWYYRLGVKTGGYTSGSVVMTLTFSGGSSTGIVRCVEYLSATTMLAEVLENSPLASTDATRTWKRGDWNATDGFPSAVTDGYARLWFGRGAKVWCSKSDDFTSFESVADEADSSFSRNLATPSSDSIRWMAMLNYLVVGTGSVEQIGLGNTQADPVGPANFQFLDGSQEGGASVQPITAAGSVLYVHRSRKKLMQFTQNPKAVSETSYISVDLTARAPEILKGDIVDIAVQREPERRIYVVLASGRLWELLFRREGDLDVVAWSMIDTDGRVERIAVMPRVDEDVVYCIVRRKNAAGTWERFIERLGPERIKMDCDRYHLDTALGYELEKPETVATPSDVTGSVIVTADDAVFEAGDVGKVLWINGGRGTITSYGNTTAVTMTVTSELDSAEPASSQRWGMRAPTDTLTGLGHLEGQSVRVWGDMTDLGDYTVASGSVTLTQPVSVAYAGKPYRSRWKSLKLSYGAQKGTALGMKKAIKALVLLLYKTGASLTYGKNFAKLRPVPTRTPAVPLGEPLPLFTGEKDHAFDATYDADSRLVFEVDGPAPCTIAGYVPILDEKDR